MTESIDTVVIGGGQSGLAVGYHLKRQRRDFVILDASARVGDAWRNRWDSLLLFTPARYNGLPGMRYPASGGSFIGKDAMADFLEDYATHFELPVRSNTRVERLSKNGGGYLVQAGSHSYVANNVVVAMSNHQSPWLPQFAKQLRDDIMQVHSSEYKNPSQLQRGATLVVGVGNSGADIALELAKTHATHLAGTPAGVVPFRIQPFVARNVLVRMVRFVGHHVLTVRTPIGRKVRPKMLVTAAPLIRVKPKDLADAGVQRSARITGVQDGLPVTDDGAVLDVANVVWCTGYRPGFTWIDLPIFGDRQEPMHQGGVVASQPGLYFVGLHFLYAMTSDTITGMARDAGRVARHLGRRRGLSHGAAPALEAAA